MLKKAASCTDFEDSLYDAALHPKRWVSALRSIGESVGADVSLLFSVDLHSGRALLLHATESGPPLVALARDHMVNPWSQASQRNPVGTIARTERLVPNEILMESAFYADVLEPAGLLYSLGANLINERGILGCFSFLRSRNSREFKDEDLDALRPLLPHFRRAAEVSMRLAEADMLALTALDVLHHLESAVFLIDEHREVRFANQAAEVLLSCTPDLRLRQRRLTTSSPGATAALERLLEGAGKIGADRGETGGGYVAVPRQDSITPLILLVVPLVNHSLRVEYRRPVVAVFAGEQDRLANLPDSALAQIFGLTATEARVAKLVARGSGLEHVAREQGVSLNTVRTQTARIFGKTGTSRQAELANVLLAEVPRFYRRTD